MLAKIEKWDRWVAWCSPGGGSFYYEKESEDREGIFWANDVVNAAREILKEAYIPMSPASTEKMARLRGLFGETTKKVCPMCLGLETIEYGKTKCSLCGKCPVTFHPRGEVGDDSHYRNHHVACMCGNFTCDIQPRQCKYCHLFHGERMFH